ncbi:uncharacterized protein LOC124540575 [Vanessa cardui]|uniref:uncharacterized protein LOC124540575 n=1 Tax=Vanessa cardui TaxID=171605 RepID=UPI001F13DCE2|nr:uncharacterized protein LOC124540575 [Vanessa cardui]
MTLEEEMTRFQREELFKHNALRNCKQKLAVTVKTTSVPNQVFGDEYVPIEHVLGSNKKKIRLLNPYVLRLRRKLPFQRYKLHKVEHNLPRRKVNVQDWSTKIDTISAFDYGKGIDIINPKLLELSSKKKPINLDDYVDTSWSELFELVAVPDGGSISIFSVIRYFICGSRNCMALAYFHVVICAGSRVQALTGQGDRPRAASRWLARVRSLPAHCHRSENQFFVERDWKYPVKHLIQDERNHIEGNGKDYYDARLHNYNDNYSELKNKHVLSNIPFEKINRNRFNQNLKSKEMTERNNDAFDKNNKNDMVGLDIDQSTNPSYNINFDWSNNSKDIETENYFKTRLLDDSILEQGNNTNEEYDFVLYKIGDPDLWCSTQVQLYEKITSPEGKILWNDLTKHNIASQKYVLYSAKLGDFIIVPSDDIITLNGQKDINKRNDNTFNAGEAPAIEGSRQVRRRVAVRTARALIGGTFKNFKMITRGSDRFLKLPHTKPHQTQIDVEVRADDNELVLVGIQGRLTTIVSDSTRSTRSILSIQAANTGLAGARLRVEIRECTPKLISATTETRDGESTLAGPVLFPPRHTQSFRLDLPLTIPVDNAHCTVALVNENEEAVAVRDVKIKRDDRCFCVWHCDCVCLSEDSNLLCRPLSDAQLVAAGLSTQEKSRHIRSVCYNDVMTLNLFVMFVGVLLALLLLGVIKATLGLILSCVGSYGLDLLIQTPRKLDQYYEDYLKCRTVVYDEEGWPIHPDTKQRSVRLISKPMEFFLNLIFFITLPCLLVCDALKKIVSCYNTTEKKYDGKYVKRDTKKCFSSRDVQSLVPNSRHRQEDLHRWMSPQAEELSTGIWQEGLKPQGKDTCECLQPLLRKEKYGEKNTDQTSCLDSEHGETEYILMQMQKSRESLEVRKFVI